MKKIIIFIIVALFLVSFAFASYGPGKAPSASSSSGSSSSSSSGGGGGGGGRGVGGACVAGYTKVDGVCVKTEPAEAAVAETPDDVVDQGVSDQVPAEAAADNSLGTTETEGGAILSGEEIGTSGKGVMPGWLWATLAVVAVGALVAVYINTQKR